MSDSGDPEQDMARERELRDEYYDQVEAMSEATTDMRLVQTCGACPEQYDAYVAGRQVGYLRLRHGYFTVDFPDCGGETVYEASTIGDGVFDPSERDHHIQRAKEAIAAAVTGEAEKPL